MKLSLVIVFVIGFAMYWYGNKRLNKMEEERRSDRSKPEDEVSDDK